MNVLDLLFGLFGDAVLVWAANLLLQASAIACVALLCASLLRRRAAVRYSALYAALWLLLLCPLAAAVMQSTGAGWLTLPIAGQAQTVGEASPEPAAHSNFSDAVYAPSVESPLTLAAGAAKASHTVTMAPSASSSVLPENVAATEPPSRHGRSLHGLRRAGAVLLVVWFAGVAIKLVRLLVASRRLAQLLRQARAASVDSGPHLQRATDMLRSIWRELATADRSAPQLVFSSRVRGPVAAGMRKPCILLPASLPNTLDDQQLRSILLHEAAHVARGDQVVTLLQHFVEAIYWLLPPVRSLQRALGQAREEVCDNYVLAAADAPTYSRTLLKLSHAHRSEQVPAGAMGLFTSRWRLEDRVAGLLDQRRSRATRASGMAMVAIATATAGLGILAALSTASVATATSTTSSTTIATRSSKLETRATDAELQLPQPTAQVDAALTLQGKVSDASQQPTRPAAGAIVAVVETRLSPGSPASFQILAEQRVGADGQYRLSIPSGSKAPHRALTLIALASGKGSVVKMLGDQVDATAIDLELKAEQLIRLKLVDAEGRAASGLTFRLRSILNSLRDGVGWGDLRLKELPEFGVCRTDDNGMLTIAGLSAGQGVILDFAGDERFSPQELALNTGISEERGERDATYRPLVRNMKAGEIGQLTLEPARFFEGVVLAGGKPVSGADVSISSTQEVTPGSWSSVSGSTDEAGRFRINAMPGVRFSLMVKPPAGSGLQIGKLREFSWDPEASKRIEVQLKRGATAAGVVVDGVSGQPLAGAFVQYYPNRARNTNVNSDVVTGWQGVQRTDAQGKFSISVYRGPGTLVVHAPGGGSYVIRSTTEGELDGKQGGQRLYAHAFESIDPESEQQPESLTIRLTPGKTAELRAIDEAGKPMGDAYAVSRLNISPLSPNWRGNMTPPTMTILGLADGEQYEAYVLSATRRLGATVKLSTADLKPTITLKACGVAKARLTNPDGKPVANKVGYGLHLVVTPGAPRFDAEAFHRGDPIADEDFAANVDRRNHGELKTDANGWIEFPALIPGATYRLEAIVDGKLQILKEFQAQSGKTSELGEFAVQIP
ncbi:MAG: hypothetical protein KDB14_23130 [Planctomycetales bacterium]|nr:hypothetical protein [Planctomycetales bacterium]